MNNVALVVIYNHQYNKNIEVIESIYAQRFSNIYHLVPFYIGEKPNVISVYDNSYYFQGYVAQGYKSFFREEYSHYIFIADDLILNPIVNENNYAKHTKLSRSSSFLPGFVNLHDCQGTVDYRVGCKHLNISKGWWPRVGEAFRHTLSVPGIEVTNLLPDYDTALQAFKRAGLTINPLTFSNLYRRPSSLRDMIKILLENKYYVIKFIHSSLKRKKYYLPYPCVGSYSDFSIVSSDSIKLFCHYCGVLSATRLFVEVGLPTALVLATKDIVTEKDLELQGEALWTPEDSKILDKYDNQLKSLLNNFPSDFLYLHPIKLSQWNTEL